MQCDKCGSTNEIGIPYNIFKGGCFCDPCFKIRKWEQDGSILTDKAERQIRELMKCGTEVEMVMDCQGSAAMLFGIRIVVQRDQAWILNRLINAIWKQMVLRGDSK